MPVTDLARRLWPDFRAALELLTRLPLPARADDAARPSAGAAWAWPLAGLVPAAAAGVGATASAGLGLPPSLCAAFALAAGVTVTGAMHEDGLADCADGFWGGWDAQRRLDIMKDSHIGSYGVLALALSVLIRWQALAAILSAGWLWAPLVASAALSRAVMPALMAALPNARGSGLSASVGSPNWPTAGASAGLALALALVFLPLATVTAAASGAILAAVVAGATARAKIGGQTGDVLGAGQQLAEIAALTALAATL
ncbi:MAG: adenosylcobinamide-GDP ribazoletransferase [Paracoccaceae bacterium]